MTKPAKNNTTFCSIGKHLMWIITCFLVLECVMWAPMLARCAEAVPPIGEVGLHDDTLTHTPQTVFLDHSYQNPVVFAQPLSRDGGHTAVVRIIDVRSDQFTLYVHESPNMDGKHTTEAVSYLVLEAGTWQLANGAQMEVGTVNTAATVGRGVTNVWERIDFETLFSAEPVVFSQVQTENDAHWVKTRQRNADATGFQVALEEEENKGTPHGSETIGWVAMDAGTGSWNGYRYEAGQTADAVTHTWYHISFGANFGRAPHFLAGLATYDGGDSAHLRYDRSSLTASGVDVMVEEDTAWDEEKNHTTEKVNYLAIVSVGEWPYPWIAQGSKLGVHGIHAGESVNFAIDLAEQNLNFSVVKAVDDLSWLKEVKQISPDTIIIGRLTSPWEGCGRVEDPNTDLDQLADNIIGVITDKLALEPDLRDAVDYWEAVNEPDPPGAYGYRRLGELMIKCMERAEAIGLKLAIFSLNAGTPEWDEMVEMVGSGAFERARQGGHILALHEGVFGTTAPIDYLWGEQIPGSPVVNGAGALCFRYRYIYHLLEQRGAVIPVVVSEFYTGGGYSQDGTSPEEIRDRVAWYDAEAAKDYYFLSFLPFTLGPVGQWHSQDYTWAYPRLLDYMGEIRSRDNAVPPAGGDDDGDDDDAANLVTNGDFGNGLSGWLVWTQRGTLNPTVESGQLHMQSSNHNGGLYQQFRTGGAGAEISIRGFWASDPTAPNTQWAEVLVIDGSRLPVDGEDINDGQSDVVLVYKNDTWATPGGWSGSMDQTAAVVNEGSFVASDDVATIILKSGNMGGATTGTHFDDILVETAAAPPPENRAPTAVATATPTVGALPLTATFDATGSSDADGDALTYSWDFGDGAQGTGAAVSYTYYGEGEYTATVTVDDGRGGWDTATVTITVTPEVILEEYFDTMDDWYDQGVQQLRNGWFLWSATGHNPLGNPNYNEPWNDWQTPEAIFRWDAFLPPEEHEILLNERGFTYKIFEGYRAWHMRLSSPVLWLEAGTYRLSLKYYCDAYVGYDGGKIPPSDPLAFEAKLNLGELQDEWVPADPLTDNIVSAEFEIADGEYDVSFELRSRWAIRNGGAFVKWFVLERLI